MTSRLTLSTFQSSAQPKGTTHEHRNHHHRPAEGLDKPSHPVYIPVISTTERNHT
nr:MAG TPA: hypothetical protein [Caudoviricetes sp.]